MSKSLGIYGQTDGRGGFLGLGEINFGRGVTVEPMPTALVMICTQDGFVVASDGQGNRVGGIALSREQKIFEIMSPKNPTRKLVYGVAGAASLVDEDTEEKTDIFKQIYRDALTKLDGEALHTANEYVDRFVEIVRPAMHRELKRGYKGIHLPDRRELSTDYATKFYFAGFFGEENPVLIGREISFWYNKWCVAHLKDSNPANPCEGVFWGSEIVRKRIQPLDSEFNKFYSDIFKRLEEQNTGVSLEEAKVAARQYIAACKSEEGKKADDRFCPYIGGDTYIGTVTLENNFVGGWDKPG